MPKVTRKKGNAVQVDFTGVEAGGRLLPEDTYLFEVTEVEVKTSDESDKQYLAFTLSVSDGEYEGVKAWDNMSLQPQALWKLKGFMETLGMEADGLTTIDPDAFVGLMVQASVIHEEYKGKSKHRITDYFPADESAGTSAPAPAAAPAAAKKKAAAPAQQEDEPAWAKGQKVKFMDGKKQVSGKITEIDGEKLTVRVGSDEYEVDASDVEAA